eukprot:comp12068_c0_seq1/m.6787 comp12068_c0_seq1/g.6787  ORF comp12068_c0_seq1/g.6787 comp12068_c0_seq1/m.6787 type:complete len:262 (-) comp12068_c0_seq1:227-1012(-)
MGLASELEAVFGSSDLYKVLGAEKGATAGQVKTAYYKASLKLHPDRVKEEEKEQCVQATLRFQLLGKVYGVLGDDERRKVYDETGDTGDDDLQQERDWAAYWRLLFKNVTVQNIKDFKKKYQNSEDEKKDLMQAYNDHNGDMGAILEHVMCAEAEDEPRLRAILQECLDKGELKPKKAFTKEKLAAREKRRKKAESEAKEAEKAARELGINIEGEADEQNDSLRALILSNQKKREAGLGRLFAGLEAKYALQPKPSKRQKK